MPDVPPPGSSRSQWPDPTGRRCCGTTPRTPASARARRGCPAHPRRPSAVWPGRRPTRLDARADQTGDCAARTRCPATRRSSSLRRRRSSSSAPAIWSPSISVTSHNRRRGGGGWPPPGAVQAATPCRRRCRGWAAAGHSLVAGVAALQPPLLAVLVAGRAAARPGPPSSPPPPSRLGDVQVEAMPLRRRSAPPAAPVHSVHRFQKTSKSLPVSDYSCVPWVIGAS